MSHGEKSFWFNKLKEAGWVPEQHYRMYSTSELVAAYSYMVEQGAAEPAEYGPPGDETVGQQELPGMPEPLDPPTQKAAQSQQEPPLPQDVIRVDEEGRQWLQEEVKKPAFPKPRGRRVLRYQDPGVRKQRVTVGDYTEEFEVAGDPKNSRPSEIKITLPSFQVGRYRDPRFPFTVVTYNGNIGFDRKEVEKFYGGADMVPPVAKRIYVENVLCYDVRSVIRAIQEEERQLILSGHINRGSQ